MSVTFESHWSGFKKTLTFPTDFNDFMQLYCQLGLTWGHLGVDLGSPGATLVPAWALSGQPGVNLGPI